MVLELKGNDAEDSISLSYAQLMLKRWKAAKDDTQAIDIHFGKKAKYWTLIEAVNKVKAIGLNIYVPYQDHFYAFWNFHPIKASIPIMPCAGTIYLDAPVNHNWFEKAILLIKKALPDYWPAAILFVVMSVSAVIRIRRENLLHA
ncbi:hypothetical protein KHS38_06325 [Mucilaginibacter sp. Bleaf8]|uniref:hypothetical protein n=1 Tax=Mucilaginibacter sp. Bleaf8 TaxID=2834430 RepID=UPI001BD035C6|nr:hypothetical protein [Mucilaginibacter sp. Bleaf8]MBS7564016.1 hypothetical protein [Mucilaginibacter sp. Bleaf8]